MHPFERLGVFYLGRPYDLEAKKHREGLVLYDSKDLVTHGVCVGMTGSGKTGLCIALLEEAAIDGIPSIVIDPKGDMGNLLLTFPELRPEDFRPWINEDDARRKNLSPEEYAAAQAQLWREGLAAWGQDGERIRRLKESAEFVIYTPGSTAGIPVSIVKSFSAPPKAIVQDTELLTEQVTGTANSLLALLGIVADPIKSREHILLSTILYESWRQGIDLDLPSLIQQITSPPFAQIGVVSLESFFPADERFKLAIQLNNLLAAPGFAAWMQGESLDVNNILYTPSGKPKVSIFSISHLNDAERMFFVTLLLNQVLSWTRVQSGTTSLRAILYMDEIAGYFPPVAAPPSKAPLLTLLKQARAFGLGVLLTTQNPVDLDYKGLSNTGTWFIGRLQTERDKMRVLDGLQGAAAAQNMEISRQQLEQIISSLGQRVFLMNNVHDVAPTIFETRWAMSYLRGPLTRNQIVQLSAQAKTPDLSSDIYRSTYQEEPSRMRPVETPNSVSYNQSEHVVPKDTEAPVLPPNITQRFVPLRSSESIDRFIYRPMVLGRARVGFRDTKKKIDFDKNLLLAAPFDPGSQKVNWEQAIDLGIDASELDLSPTPGIAFAPVPQWAAAAKNYSAWAKDLADWLYRTQQLEILMSPTLKVFSNPTESERDFRIRLEQAFREKRDEAIESLRKKYAAKIQSAQSKVSRAEDAVSREKLQAKQQQKQTAISAGAALLSSFLGNKKLSSSTLDRATTTARGASRYAKEMSDVERSEETLKRYIDELHVLEEELIEETEKLSSTLDPMNEVLEVCVVRPFKKDISVEPLALVWVPVEKN
ncbi:MAG: ATP-binding protein [Firmicutes bacterium]|nr:ATP-binding protein [Candidatus Fermentithermobacillaceae bacterium]